MNKSVTVTGRKELRHFSAAWRHGESCVISSAKFAARAGSKNGQAERTRRLLTSAALLRNSSQAERLTGCRTPYLIRTKMD